MEKNFIEARGGNAMQNGLLGQTAITSNTMRLFPTLRLFKVRGLLRQNDEIRTALKMFPTVQGRAKRCHSKSNFDLYSPPSPPCSLKPLSREILPSVVETSHFIGG